MKTWYKTWHHKWHESKYHPHLRWGTFVAVCLLAGNFLIGQINSAYQFAYFEIPTIQAQTAGPHDYFNSLAAHPTSFFSESLRDARRFDMYRTNVRGAWTYVYPSVADPSVCTGGVCNDSFSDPQDGVKLTLVPYDVPAVGAVQSMSLAGSEQMKFPNKTTNFLSENIRCPASGAGPTVMITWDWYWDRSMRENRGALKQWKYVQVALGGAWWTAYTFIANPTTEPQYVNHLTDSFHTGLMYASHVDREPFEPSGLGAWDQSGKTTAYPEYANRWTRYWLEIKLCQPHTAFTEWNSAGYPPGGALEANTQDVEGRWHMVSKWIADEGRDPQRLLFRVPLNARMDVWDQIFLGFTLEHNSSNDGGAGPWIGYGRNLIILKNYTLPGSNPESDTFIFQRPLTTPIGYIPPPIAPPPPSPTPTPSPNPTPNPTPTPSPTPAVIPEIIIDNTQASITGVWKAATDTITSKYYGANYLHDSNELKGQKNVKYTPNIATSGEYNVYMIWNAHSGRANNVPIVVTDSNGSRTYTLNQTQGGAWTLLGTHTFSTGTGNNVIIKNDGTNGYVIADAVGFTLVSSQPLRGDLNNDNIVNSIDWSIMNSKWFTNDPVADLNQDGIVNAIDFSILNQNWLRIR